MGAGRKKEQADNKKDQCGYAFFHCSLFFAVKINPAPVKTYEVHQPVINPFENEYYFYQAGSHNLMTKLLNQQAPIFIT